MNASCASGSFACSTVVTTMSAGRAELGQLGTGAERALPFEGATAARMSSPKVAPLRTNADTGTDVSGRGASGLATALR